jgi:hypothetical protein
MKQKIFYILLIICCMSLFSSAKQSGKESIRKTCCDLSKAKCTNQIRPKAAKETDFDLPPLKLLMFDL